MDLLVNKLSSRSLTLVGITIDQRWLRLAVPLGLFAAIFVPRLLGLGAFLTADEDDQIMFSSLFLKSVLQGDFAGALVLGYPGVPTLILGGLGVALRYWFHYQGWLPLAWVQADLLTTLGQVTTRFGVFEYPLDFLVWVRLPLALTASLSIWGIYLLTKRLLDERLALVGTLIIAFDPFILAHTRLIHVDAPLAYFMFLSFLAFLLYLDRGSWRWLLLSGLFGGLAGLSKTPAALLGPILVVSGLFYALFPPVGLAPSVRWKRLGIALVGWGLIAAAAFTALWPAMWTRPMFALEWIIKNIRSVNQIAHPTTGHFWGGQLSDQSPYYYLLVFPFHLTPLTTIGVAAALVLLGVGLLTYRRHAESWPVKMLPLVLSLSAYVVMFIGPVSLISRRGDRYILPVFFAAGLLAALALWWLAGLVKQYLLTFNRWVSVTGITAIVVIIQALVVLWYHPYYLAYYNPLWGGGEVAPYRLNVGWGEGLDAAARYLNDLHKESPPAVASWYSKQFAPFYQGKTIDLSSQSAALTGDYTVFYLNQVQRGFPSREIVAYFQQREPLHVVKLGEIDYAWIYPGPIISKTPPAQYTFATQALLAGGARLVGVDVPRVQMPVDAYPQITASDQADAPRFFGQPLPGLPVTLFWETVGQINGEHNVYIRLVDAQGNIWGRVDRLILAGLWRPDRWRAGYFVRDEYKLPIDPATPPGEYQLEVGLYDFVTGQSYGVVKNIGTLTLTPPAAPPQPAQLNLPQQLFTPLTPALTLLGHDFQDVELAPGAEINGKVFWQGMAGMDQDYQVEFAFLAPDNKKYVIAEAPLSPTYPNSQWRRNEAVGAAYRFRIPASTPAGNYPLLITALNPDTHEPLAPSVTLASVIVKAQERNFDLPRDVTPVSAFLNEEIELIGYKLHQSTVAPKNTFGLTLYWRSVRPTTTNYTVFIHAVGPDQVIRGQWDSVPRQGAAPTSGWLPGEVIEDDYQIPMAKDAPAWKYDIFAGMYDALTGQRLPAASHNSPISENRVWLTRVQVEEKP